MLISDNTLLRSIEEDDLEQLREWRNKPELRSFFREYREISREDQISWYKNIVLPKTNTLMFAIINKKTQDLLGACGLCYVDWLRKSADLSIYIGYNNIYLDDLYAIESANELINYGFNELGLHRLWAEVYSHDIQKQQFFDKLNFRLEGRFRESHRTNGKWVDSLFYSKLEHD